MSGVEIDATCLVIADMVDMRMPNSVGHSRAVAQLAESAARLMGLPEREIVTIRRAGWVHDIGELVLPVAAWTRPGSFSEDERDQLRLHAWHGERILSRAGTAFLPLATLTGRHPRTAGRLRQPPRQLRRRPVARCPHSCRSRGLSQLD